MKKNIKYFALFLSLALLMAGCKGKNQIDEKDIPKQDVNSVISIEDDIVEDNDDTSIDVEEDNQPDTIADELFDVETIRKILAYKYQYETPFHLDFSHEDENGCYVYHFFEVVTNEDESHTATADWFTVNPKTGETTTFYGDTFNLKDYASYADEAGTPGYLFDRFLHGEIDAEVLNPLEPEEWAFEYGKINISNLNFEPEEWSWDAFYFGGKEDLDNDGENEFILDGPYGGMYFDVIDGTLYVFAAARGNAGGLKYTYYDDAYWIVYHDTTHGGRLCYWLYKYEGADNLVDSMTLMGFVNSEDDKEFTFNGESITEDEFDRIHDEIFESKDKE